MAVYEYQTEEELDEAFARIEDINMQHVDLREAVEEARKNLADVEEELADFEADNKDILF